MSLTDLLPGRREKPRRKHRADDRIAELEAQHAAELAELRAENVKLWDRQAAADDHFALLAEDVTVTNEAWEQEQQRRLLAEKALQQAEDVIRLRDRRIADLERRVDVGVKAEHVIAKTQELSAEEIRRHCTPRPLWESPLANPAHTPAWARQDDDTQPLPAA